jgi:hypothetical protein
VPKRGAETFTFYPPPGPPERAATTDMTGGLPDPSTARTAATWASKLGLILQWATGAQSSPGASVWRGNPEAPHSPGAHSSFDHRVFVAQWWLSGRPQHAYELTDDGNWYRYRGHWVRRREPAGATDARRFEIMLALDRAIAYAPTVSSSWWTPNLGDPLQIGAALEQALAGGIAFVMGTGEHNPLPGGAGGLTIFLQSDGTPEQAKYDAFVSELEVPEGALALVVLSPALWQWGSIGWYANAPLSFTSPSSAARTDGWLLPRVNHDFGEAIRTTLWQDELLGLNPPQAIHDPVEDRISLWSSSGGWHSFFAFMPNGDWPANTINAADITDWQLLVETVAHEATHVAFHLASAGQFSGAEGQYCDGPYVNLFLNADSNESFAMDAHYFTRAIGCAVADEACYGMRVGASHHRFCCGLDPRHPGYGGNALCP